MGVQGWAISLGLWCMSPAVAFSQVAKGARSIILTSGTLSPMDSFASEVHACNMHVSFSLFRALETRAV